MAESRPKQGKWEGPGQACSWSSGPALTARSKTCCLPRQGTRPTRFPRKSACIVGPVPSPGGFFNGLLSVRIVNCSSLAEKDQPQHKREQGRQTRIDQDRYKKNDFQARQQPMGEACQENTSDEANEPRRKERADDVESGRSGAS